MALDRILPKKILVKNKRGSSFLIFIAFFLLSVSVLLITEGNLEKLAGVYTIAFLGVMVLFGIGNLLLKAKRNKLTFLSLILLLTRKFVSYIGYK